MKNLNKLLFALIVLCSTQSVFAQVPVYNSYPAASAVIFLDFDGHQVDGTSWNSNGPFTCASANVTTAQITEIFNRISEDYRPFNINVTTDSTKYWAAPTYKRTRVVFTTSNEWYGNNSGGVAFIGSFTWGDNSPCFVFTNLLTYNTKWLAEAGAHEAGHTLGLRHQSAYDGNCVKTGEYNAGVGSGEIAWAPIMGVGYYRNMTLWNNGANPYGCTNFQDDLGIITGLSNGIGYRTDDYASTTSGASTVNFTGNQLNLSGVIEQGTDADVFKITMPINGHFHMQAVPFNIGAGNDGSDLDIQVEILKNPSTIIGTYNPSVILSATIDTLLDAGNYYIRVTGKGNAYAPQYASLGSYSLQASYSPGTALPVHQLQLKGAASNGKHALNWTIVADETIAGQTLEISENGREFHTLASLANNAKNYEYTPSAKTVLYYRLNVIFDNGSQYFSNVTALRCNAVKNEPFLVSNQVTQSLNVNSTEVMNYSIRDLGGRLLAAGKLSAGLNTIDVNRLAGGMYLMQFEDGNNATSQKFIKR